MDVPLVIPIPLGVSHVATVRGAVWKLVDCEQCHEQYAYLLKLKATGEERDMTFFFDGEDAAKQAKLRAKLNLAEKGRNLVLPVPCPHCGQFQADMVRVLKEDAKSDSLLVAGLVVAALSLMPLAFSIPYNWVITVAGVAVGLFMIVYADVSASWFDPNSIDPIRRKSIGQKHSVWGEQLRELLETKTDKVIAPTEQPT